MGGIQVNQRLPGDDLEVVMTENHKKKARKIGPEKQEFELELTPVTIHRTFKDRIVDAAWTIGGSAIASAIAITIVHVWVLPLI